MMFTLHERINIYKPWRARTPIDGHEANALRQMGYEIHDDGAWWPEYDYSEYDQSDWKKQPNPIQKQFDRLKARLYSSPNQLIWKRT